KQNARLEVFDLSGKRVKTIFAGELAVGEHRFELFGEGLSAGIYFVQMQCMEGIGFCRKVVKLY
ncbi:MAG TPA: hypothetical protein PK228_15780, partial [Saprospiraceae bacterium]|nr:hypothetical protein [Saprospiraceae bacterium]